MGNEASVDVFSLFSKPVHRVICEHGFTSPTEPQVKAIPLILEGKNVLLVAPTGTGKTEAAFLPILNALYTMKDKPLGIKALYITPLRALNRDLLERLAWWCKKLDIRLAVRHGDTEVGERGRQAHAPPDILITTPETLQAILAGWVMRRHLGAVRWVIVDEVHELSVDKRGSQLTLALERLRYIAERDFQIIGLSATVGTPEEVASFLVGFGRPCEVVKVPVARFMKLEIVYPKPRREDFELASKLYTYPEVAARLRVMRSLIEKHKSVLIFTNTRTEAEVLASRFRVWDADFPVGVHHGSLSKPTRVDAERRLKDGRLQGIVCTSSLELGIDIGPLEMAIQYNSPRQVTRLVQRVGRSGHRIRGLARGVVITQDADDTLEALVIARRAYLEDLEPVVIPEKPFDALNHQIVGLLLHKSRWSFQEALQLFNKAYPYRSLSEEDMNRVLSYMHSRYPRLSWVSFQDRFFMKPQGIKGFYDYYFENLSMIPEEKQYLVVEDDIGSPVGVLDEAFVAEHGEIGTKFIEAGRVWKILHIYQDKVYVKSDEDPTGAIPSWVGEEIPVPFEVASEVGSIRRLVEDGLRKDLSLRSLVQELSGAYPGDTDTLAHALMEVKEQVEASIPVPTDRRVTVEGWEGYVIVNCCFGHLVNRTLARVLGHLLSKKLGASVGVHQDPYRVILHAPQVSAVEVKALLTDLAAKDVKQLAVDALLKTGIFKRRLIHVAKKFGVLRRDADISSVSLDALAESLKGSAVFDEAVKTSLYTDADVNRLSNLLSIMALGDIEVVLLEGLKEVSPISRIALEELARRSDLIRPERLRKVILESARARLLNEARTLLCTGCWDYIETLAVKMLSEGYRCPSCSSEKLALIEEPEEKVRFLSSRLRVKSKPPKRFRSMMKRIMKSSELYMKYGFAAALVMAGRHISVSDAEEILKEGLGYSDALIERIVEAEKRALKRRYFLS